jgi:hypothetical protein
MNKRRRGHTFRADADSHFYKANSAVYTKVTTQLWRHGERLRLKTRGGVHNGTII